MTGPRSARVSLTKLQRDSAAGVELIAICRQVTEDGRLLEQEVADLADWIDRYHDSPLAGHLYLKATLERVTADGVVTAEELREVYSAIERVLPPDLRSEVVARRRAHDAAERDRNSPDEGWDFMVAGCRYDGRPTIIEAHCRAGDEVFLVRDPSNRYSRFAVEVLLRTGHQIGYVPESDVRDLAPLLDADRPYRARVKKILTGGRAPIPIVVADVFSIGSTTPGLRTRADAPARLVSAGAPAKAGCATSLMLLAGAATLGIAIYISP